MILSEATRKSRTKANTVEAMWKASETAYRERQQREIRAQWYRFFSDMADSHARLSEDYARRAEERCAEGGE